MEQQTPTTEKSAAASFLQFDASAWSAEHMLKAWLAYQLEAMRFAGLRGHKTLEFLRHLSHCANWQEIGQLQQNWVKDCVADYGEEWGRMMGTGFALALSDVAPFQPLIRWTAASAHAKNEPRLAA